MNKEDYRAQVDAVSFSPDFQKRTMARLMDLAQEKEKIPMKKFHLRTGLVAAAVVATLSVTTYAAVVMLRPQDVAQKAGRQAVAAAFERGEAVTVNETRTVEGYNVTFMGLISGEGLSDVEGVTRDRTYAVLAYARTDGKAIADDVPELTVSPLVEGYAPWEVNAWTLSGGTCTFAQEGTLYYLFECDNVEPFADHTVYLAVYPGTHTPPGAELFDFDEDTGAITAKGDTALFALPLDRAKADPQKAQALLDEVFGDPPTEGGEPADDLSADQTLVISADPDHPGQFLVAEK